MCGRAIVPGVMLRVPFMAEYGSFADYKAKIQAWNASCDMCFSITNFGHNIGRKLFICKKISQDMIIFLPKAFPI